MVSEKPMVMAESTATPLAPVSGWVATTVGGAVSGALVVVKCTVALEAASALPPTSVALITTVYPVLPSSETARISKRAWVSCAAQVTAPQSTGGWVVTVSEAGFMASEKTRMRLVSTPTPVAPSAGVTTTVGAPRSTALRVVKVNCVGPSATPFALWPVTVAV